MTVSTTPPELGAEVINSIDVSLTWNQTEGAPRVGAYFQVFRAPDGVLDQQQITEEALTMYTIGGKPATTLAHPVVNGYTILDMLDDDANEIHLEENGAGMLTPDGVTNAGSIDYETGVCIFEDETIVSGVATSYYYYPNATDWALISPLLPINVGDYLDTGLDPETVYYYRVRAFDTYSTGPYSNAAYALTTSPLTEPGERMMLIYRSDLGAIIDYLDLLSAPYELAKYGWQQSSVTDQEGIEEVLTLHLTAASDDALAAAVQALDLKVKQVELSKDTLQKNGVWLRTQLPGETNARQAYIVAMKRSPKIDILGPLMGNTTPTIAEYQLGITRRMWEATTYQTISDRSGLSINGGYSTMLNSFVPGDEPARIARCVIGQTSDNDLNEFWIGVKDERYGNTALLFDPVWNWHKGTIIADTGTTEETDSDALDGSALVVDLDAHPEKLQRATLNINQEKVSDFSHQIGHYTVLLRAHAEVGTYALVRIGSIDAGGSWRALTNRYAYKGWQQITYDEYLYYNMGNFSIPAWQVADDYAVNNFEFSIEAQFQSGLAGSLSIDSIVLVPYENSLHIDIGTPSVDQDNDLAIYTTPDQRLYAVLYDTTSGDAPEGYEIPQQNNWSIPPGTSRYVLVAQNKAGGLGYTTGVVSLSLDVYPRYQTLRGTQ
jgi:hypothetical protein